ncbi:glycosyltransferase [Paenibacillus sp. HJL G12]|uniref:Glycosyltransferase n=1 Tax=Paenibacillus dendrobii TaxID=2691084 RepID=A0A7X3IGV1_9BACL|nr:glycosyltransferase family 4 protein [Paenibacillus dendrobii]MWV43694.1 glycosyltransferase [Paenibacillus dendrobii]
MKLIMVGPVPPPLGGISVHIHRLSAVIRTHHVDYVIYNEFNIADAERHILPIGSYKRFLLKIPFIQGDLFHFHSIDPRMRMLLGIYKALGKKIMLTVHGESLSMQLQEASPLSRKLLLASLKRIDCIVCVSESTTQMLTRLGFRDDRVCTVPAYIHPVERNDDELAIPAEVHRFMDQAEFLISANGFVRPLQEGDLYGIDLLVELMSELTDSGVQARLLFAMLGAKDQSAEERRYYELLKKRIADYGLSQRFLFYEVEDSEFYPILKKSHLFIRPTRMDGYGVSVAEALYYKVPAIASDVCRRPEGTILFRQGDHKNTDLIRVVRQTLINYQSCKQDITGAMTQDYAADLMDIYYRISGRRPVERKVINRANR